MHIKSFWVILIVFSFIIGKEVFASLFVNIDFDELVKRSEGIVQGEVLKVESYLDKNNGMVFSLITFKVEKIYKGEFNRYNNQIIIKEAGGIVGGKSVEPIGFPKFRIGELAILFITKWPDGNLRVLGYTQGKYNIIKDPVTNDLRYIREDLLQKDIVIVGEDTNEMNSTYQGPLNDLINRIENSLKK